VRAARTTIASSIAYSTTPMLNPTRLRSSPTFKVVDTLRFDPAVVNRKSLTSSISPMSGQFWRMGGRVEFADFTLNYRRKTVRLLGTA
jgi:hypothetical protein